MSCHRVPLAMAEVIGIVSGAISIATVAGQLTKRAGSLYQFFRDVSNAPTEMKKLAEVLHMLETILKSVETSFSNDGQDQKPALSVCEAAIQNLEKLLERSCIEGGLKRRIIRQRQVKDALKRPELERHLTSLGRAMIMLLQTCSLAQR